MIRSIIELGASFLQVDAFGRLAVAAELQKYASETDEQVSGLAMDLLIVPNRM